MMDKWDQRFLDVAQLVSTWSKDPSTKVGAVIVRPDMTIASTGYNGFPKYMDDSDFLYDHRETKYARIIHAEMNALLHLREPVKGYMIYTFPMLTCERCAVHIIQSGITRVCSIKNDNWRWQEAFARARNFYEEAGVEVVEYEAKV